MNADSNPWRDVWEATPWLVYRISVMLIAILLIGLAIRRLRQFVTVDGGLKWKVSHVSLTIEILANLCMYIQVR